MNPPVSKHLSPGPWSSCPLYSGSRGQIMNLTPSFQSDEQAGQAVPMRAERQPRDSRDGPGSQSPSEGFPRVTTQSWWRVGVVSFYTRRPCIVAADGGSSKHKSAGEGPRGLTFPTTKQTDPAKSAPTASLSCHRGR